MSMSDPVADLITRIRNAVNVSKESATVPYSKEKATIVKVLREEGYVGDVTTEGDGIGRELRIHLKYGPDGEKVIHHIQRVSKPGCRVYKKRKEIKRVLQGLGTGVVSTSRGILTDKECRRQNVGGEYLFEVW